VIKNDPQNLMAKNNYSYFLALEGKELDKAKELSGETIIKEPENSTYLDTYGWILFTRGEYNDAKIYLEKAIKISKEQDAEILFHFAEVLKQLGNPQSGDYYKKSEEKGYDKGVIKLRLNEISKK
jgi:tetratricopeptide (TPR) repeat protein